MPGHPPVLAEEGRRGDWQLLAWAKNPFGEIIRESGKETAFPPTGFPNSNQGNYCREDLFLREVSGLAENYRALRGREERDRGILDTSNR